MKVLVLGDGAREHALLWKLAEGNDEVELFACPGNAGIAAIATCVGVPSMQAAECAALAAEIGADLTVVGPENLLADGVVDELRQRGLAAFGPTKAAAQLESSKIWAKDVMARTGIPTAKWRAFDNAEDARLYARELGWRCAVKFDGLARGKGTVVCHTEDEVDQAVQYLLDQHHFGVGPILVEELLEGQEVSVFAVSDGRTVLPLGAAQDHKRLDDGDQGPNTGGMGAYSPVTHLRVAQDFAGRVFQPVVSQLAQQGTPFVGVLYAGAILTAQGPAILEFNCRLGDPEAEVLLPRLTSDLLPILLAATEGRLHELTDPVFSDRDAVCVVIAGADYPDKPEHGSVINGIAAVAAMSDVLVFHGGTAEEDGALVTDGGRILAITGLGVGMAAAKERAYAAVRTVSFAGAQYRGDIAATAVNELTDVEWRQSPRWESQMVDASRRLGAVAQAVAYLEAEYPDGRLGPVVEQLVDIKHSLQVGLAPLPAVDPALLLPSVSPDARDTDAALRDRVRAYVDVMQRPAFSEAADALFADDA